MLHDSAGLDGVAAVAVLVGGVLCVVALLDAVALGAVVVGS
jgi:hypothetical protein